MTASQTSPISKHIFTDNCSDREVCYIVQLSVTVSRVQQVLLLNNHFVYKRIKRASMLTKKHMDKRVEWVKTHQIYAKRLKRSIFYQEKTFNFDEINELAY